MSRLKILQICSNYLGSSLYERLFERFDADGVENHVYVFAPVNYQTNRKFPDRVLVSKCFNQLDRLSFFLKRLKVLKDIQKHYDLSQFNLTHAHTLFTNGHIAYHLKKKYGLPYVVAVRDTDVNLFFKRVPPLRGLGLRIMRQAERIIFLGSAYFDRVMENYVPPAHQPEIGDKSTIIPNGIDSFWLSRKYGGQRKPGKRLELIFVGEVSRRKNVLATLEACEMLIKRGEDLRYTVIGRIQEKKHKALMDEKPYVRYVSHCGSSEIIHYLREADIFVMPSRTETFGLAYAEAMSQGLPIIYTLGEGFANDYPDGFLGYPVDPDRPEHIVQAIDDIRREYFETSRNCLTTAGVYDWAPISRRYEALYEEISLP